MIKYFELELPGKKLNVAVTTNNLNKNQIIHEAKLALFGLIEKEIKNIKETTSFEDFISND